MRDVGWDGRTGCGVDWYSDDGMIQNRMEDSRETVESRIIPYRNHFFLLVRVYNIIIKYG